MKYLRKLSLIDMETLNMTDINTNLSTRIICVDYRDRDNVEKQTNVTIICGIPKFFIVAIDVKNRRVFNIEENSIYKMHDLYSQEDIQPSIYYNEIDTVKYDPSIFFTQPQTMALFIRSGMVCEISILLMLAEAAAVGKSSSLDIVMDFLRENVRHAVKDGKIPNGPKGPAWPIVRELIASMKPRREHLDAYVKTFNSETRHPNRFKSLSSAMDRLVKAAGEMTYAQKDIMRDFSADITRYGKA